MSDHVIKTKHCVLQYLLTQIFHGIFLKFNFQIVKENRHLDHCVQCKATEALLFLYLLGKRTLLSHLSKKESWQWDWATCNSNTASRPNPNAKGCSAVSCNKVLYWALVYCQLPGTFLRLFFSRSASVAKRSILLLLWLEMI